MEKGGDKQVLPVACGLLGTKTKRFPLSCCNKAPNDHHLHQGARLKEGKWDLVGQEE